MPYNQDFIRSTSSGENDRYAPFYQTIPSPTSGSYYYSIECRQRSTITDMYKNVGEQNLTELLFETPFEYSYKDIDYFDQNAGIYSSLGLQDELIEDSNETKERNIILKTIYIKPNLRGDGDLVATENSSQKIKGGWILSGSEDASYGSLHSLYPINCFIKFGNFETVPTLPTPASDYKGKIMRTTNSSDFYISLPTSSSAYGWVKYDSCTYKQIVGDSSQTPGFFNVQAYNLTDGQLVIKVPETFYVNTDQFYTLYYVSNPIATETTDYAYFLDSGVIGGGEWNNGARVTNNPFEVKGYNGSETEPIGVEAGCCYYDLFLSPNNTLKPDKYRPVYAEIENDDTKIEGLIINNETYDKDISVDKMDKTQYLCQFMTTVTPSSDAIAKYDIFQPQTKVRIYTQFIDSVPQQYFYARKPLLYTLGVYNISDENTTAIDNITGDINRRDVLFKATRA